MNRPSAHTAFDTLTIAQNALDRVAALAQPDLPDSLQATIAGSPLLDRWHVANHFGSPVLVGMVTENGIIRPDEPYQVYTSILLAIRADHTVATTLNRFYRLGTPATAETKVKNTIEAVDPAAASPMMDREIDHLKALLNLHAEA